MKNSNFLVLKIMLFSKVMCSSKVASNLLTLCAFDILNTKNDFQTYSVILKEPSRDADSKWWSVCWLNRTSLIAFWCNIVKNPPLRSCALIRLTPNPRKIIEKSYIQLKIQRNSRFAWATTLKTNGSESTAISVTT